MDMPSLRCAEEDGAMKKRRLLCESKGEMQQIERPGPGRLSTYWSSSYLEDYS